MEMERAIEFPHTHMDRRPRKRQRLGWDVAPQVPKAQVGIFCGQEVGNVTSFASSRAPSDHTSSSLFVKGVARNGSPPWREDDKDGHFMFALGENITSRYKIHSKMGEGTFGQVLECWDRERKEMVAIKIVRGIKKYREAAMIEIEVLQQLGKHDKGGNRCVQIRNWFDYRNHICIVFEKLGPSLYDFLRKNNYRSFPIDLVRDIGRQLLECVAFMHDLQLIHTDLKPENILLVSSEHVKVPDYKVSSRSPKDGSYFKRVPKSSAIKVIDFGSTTYDRQDQNYIVSTRHYRAPEVILGLGWSYPCDVWSVGCILVELCSGEALFQTHENLEHLAMMERVLGPLPQHMLKRVDRHSEKYVRRGKLDWPEGATSRESIKSVLKLPRLQARFLLPDELKVQELVNVLMEKKIGVVAHFYMDPEVQGVLTAAQKHWPHIHISDSLVMADSAVKMAKAGCQYITVLGVDFMSENVRAILDQAGFSEVGVYRMSSERIGCSLADAASNPAYMNYLEAASMASPSLHVVYINTSLETKANAHELVPTITCTSSNVVPTILQAFAQVPNLNVWYGPDTYMGANIMELFQQMTEMTDDEIAEIHPEHNRDTIRSLLPRLHYYQDGTCIVHHLFGHEVVEKIKEMYCDAFLTAHFEVPGEMFSLAMEAKRRGMGVVGSTQNILDFISHRVQEALERNVNEHLQFVLGTESGMVTAIVAKVSRLLGSVKRSPGRPKVNVEIVFPVSSDSITTSSTSSHGLSLGVIPGVASGEGCSINGGCASCPYMKMNSLSSLLKVCYHLPEEKHSVLAYEAGRFNIQTRHGKLIADVGCEPILHMRHFQATKRLPDKLVHQILDKCGNGRPMSCS